MKTLLCIAILAILAIPSTQASPVNAAIMPYEVLPVKPVPARVTTQQYPGSLSNSAVSKILGRKLSLKEKIALKILRRKHEPVPPEDRVRTKMGNTSMILGICALGSLLIFPLAMLPCGILAVVYGNKAKKANANDTQARTGVILGWIAIGLFVVLLAALVALIAAIGF